MYTSFGMFIARGQWGDLRIINTDYQWASMYGTGDVITVRLDLHDATVSFRKNDNVLQPLKSIATHVEGEDNGEGAAYHFVFNAIQQQAAVTIVS